MPNAPVIIRPFVFLAGDTNALAAIDKIFFMSSNTKTFANDSARAAFRQLWLGRYLQHFPESCFIAVDAADNPLGYICGSLQDPARDPVFSDQPHLQLFAHVTPNYPAQLHINLAESARGQGIGAALVGTFSRHAARFGAPGMHAISSRGARNLRFYAANLFDEVSAVIVGDKELVFLGRKLG